MNQDAQRAERLLRMLSRVSFTLSMGSGVVAPAVLGFIFGPPWRWPLWLFAVAWMVSSVPSSVMDISGTPFEIRERSRLTYYVTSITGWITLPAMLIAAIWLVVLVGLSLI